jgi:hypothetical protein
MHQYLLNVIAKCYGIIINLIFIFMILINVLISLFTNYHGNNKILFWVIDFIKFLFVFIAWYAFYKKGVSSNNIIKMRVVLVSIAITFYFSCFLFFLISKSNYIHPNILLFILCCTIAIIMISTNKSSPRS